MNPLSLKSKFCGDGFEGLNRYPLLKTPYLPRYSVSEVSNYKTIAVKTEVYNLIKERARKDLRGISNYLEHELTKEI